MVSWRVALRVGLVALLCCVAFTVAWAQGFDPNVQKESQSFKQEQTPHTCVLAYAACQNACKDVVDAGPKVACFATCRTANEACVGR